MLRKDLLLPRGETMKNFKQLREKLYVNLPEGKDMNYVVKDMKSAEFIKNELSGLVKADFKISKKGSEYQINVIPRTSQDEKVVRSFMDDARIEMLKNEFVRNVHKTRELGEEMEFTTFTGETVVLSPNTCSRIVEIHDTLHEENQEVFMDMLVHSSETFEQAKNFCETYSETKE